MKRTIPKLTFVQFSPFSEIAPTLQSKIVKAVSVGSHLNIIIQKQVFVCIRDRGRVNTLSRDCPPFSLRELKEMSSLRVRLKGMQQETRSSNMEKEKSTFIKKTCEICLFWGCTTCAKFDEISFICLSLTVAQKLQSDGFNNFEPNRQLQLWT